MTRVTRRPSHLIEPALFELLEELEERARRDATMFAKGEGLGDGRYLAAVVHTGAARDDLAQWLLERGLGARA